MARPTATVLAIRPYSARIRSRVFPALEALGADVTVLAEAGTPDDDALRAIRDAEADVLLVPFHAHRDRAGELVHGLGLIARIRAEVARHRRTPIVCPISKVGMAAAGLMTSRDDGPSLEGVLLLHERDLDDGQVSVALRRFLVERGVPVTRRPDAP